MKALCGTYWDLDKETLLITYKCLVHPILEFGAPIHRPNMSDTNIRKFQRTQNYALRIVTGCHKMIPIQHLHMETKVLPIKEHLDLLCKQFLANSLIRGYVSCDTVLQPPGQRKMKHTLYFHYIDSIKPCLTQDCYILKSNLKNKQKALHYDTVAASQGRIKLCGGPGQRLFGGPPARALECASPVPTPPESPHSMGPHSRGPH
jgi:hypothetical protein